MNTHNVLYVYCNDIANTYTIGWNDDIKKIQHTQDKCRLVYIIECQKAKPICENIGSFLERYGAILVESDNEVDVSEISFETIIKFINMFINNHSKHMALINKTTIS